MAGSPPRRFGQTDPRYWSVDPLAGIVKDGHIYGRGSSRPSTQTGFTDSHFFRARGIPSYGYSPLLVPPREDAGVHGKDERVSVENVRRGTRMMLEIARALVY